VLLADNLEEEGNKENVKQEEEEEEEGGGDTPLLRASSVSQVSNMRPRPLDRHFSSVTISST